MLDWNELPDDADEIIVGFLRDHASDRNFWMTRTPTERFTAAEYLRWMHYGREAMSQPMRKDVFRFVDISDPDA